jgi:hypothetical protein
MNRLQPLGPLSSSEDVVSALRAIDISVPPAVLSRKKFHIERWTICRLVATIVDDSKCCYPIALVHEDRPDFSLSIGQVQIGVEVSSTQLNNYMGYRALQEREAPGALLEPGHFRRGNVSLGKMRRLLASGRFTSLPYMGDSMEREWAANVATLVKMKREKLAHSEFRKLPKNWLAIDDCLPMPSYSLEDGVVFLMPLLQPLWSETPSFDLVTIDHGETIIFISNDGFEFRAVNNIWKP